MNNLKNIIAKTIGLTSAISFAAVLVAPAFNFDLIGTTWAYLLLLSVLGCFFGTALISTTEEKGGAA